MALKSNLKMIQKTNDIELKLTPCELWLPNGEIEILAAGIPPTRKELRSF